VTEHASWAADQGAALADGWEPGTGDMLLRAYVDGFADMCARIAQGLGGRVESDDAVLLADACSHAPYLNGAVIRRPLAAHEVDPVIERARGFFAAGAGGPWLLFSPLPLPDLADRGLARIGHPPFMVRPPGGERRAPPPDLEVVPVHDAATFARLEGACRDFYPVPELVGQPAGSMFPATLATDPDYRWLLGLVDDEPVGTAMAHRNAGMATIEWITSDPARRGKGYGEAMTWEATLAWPELPATLIASDDGRPTYERMGYLPIVRMTMWSGSRQT